MLEPYSDSRLDRLRPFSRTAGFALIALAGLYFVVTAVIGAVRWYSPVPINDMWASYVTFYVRASAGDWSAWFKAHGEHNLLVSKIFFWLDLRYFQGLSLVLITLNVVFMGVLWAELRFAASILLRPRKTLLFVTSALLLVPCFSWLHSENIICGFQIQFFEAFLFPLAAFQSLALSMEGKRQRLWFSVAVILGCISVGTMGNGAMLTMPLMIAMVFLSRHHVKRRLLVLVPAMILVVVYYLQHRDKPQMDVPNPLQFLEFVLLFLGSPFVAILKSREHLLVAGAVLLGGAAFSFSAWLRSAKREPMFLALLVFLAYILLSALGAARSRVVFGHDQALVDRYHTPALLAWCSLGILLIAHWRDHVALPKFLWTAAAVLPIAFFPFQLEAFSAGAGPQARIRMVSALALNLGVRDRELLVVLDPDDAGLMKTAVPARERGLTIFGLPEMIRAREYLGRPIDELGLLECQGVIDASREVAEQRSVSAVAGWVFDQRNRRVPTEVYFADENRVVMGVALSGGERKDVARVIDPNATYCGFNGYIRKPGEGKIKLFCAP